MQTNPDLSLVVTKTPDGVIGARNCLLWKIPSEFGRFKRLTTGHPVIMGYHTCASMLARCGIDVLLGRQVITLSRNTVFRGPVLELTSSIKKALVVARGASGAEEIFIIGGSELYQQFLPLAQKVYITEICAPVEGDILFPPMRPYEWRCSHQSPKRKWDTRDQYSTRFIILERVDELAHD